MLGQQWLVAFNLLLLKFSKNFKSEVNKLEVSNVEERWSKKFEELFSHTLGLYDKIKTKNFLRKSARPIA